MDDLKFTGGSISVPMIRGDGKEVLIQIQAEGHNFKIQVPTTELYTLINNLANIHTAAIVQQWLPERVETTKGTELMTPPESHTAESGLLIYGEGSEPVVSLRVQTTQDRVLLISFDTGDFQRIVGLVQTLDEPQDLTGKAN